MPPWVTMMTLPPRSFGDLRVGQIEDRADAGVAGAFAQHKILFPRDAVEGLLDFFDERLVVGRLKIFAGEIRLDGDRAHVHERAIQPIHRVHQHGVLVNFLLLDFDEALADGLDVADAREMFLQRGDQAERRGGLAVVLARGGDENARRGRCSSNLNRRRCQYSAGVGARIKFLVIDGLHADDGGDAENVVRVGAARNIGGGPVQAQQNLAVGIGVADDAGRVCWRCCRS